MKSIKKWCKKHEWLLGGIAAIQGIGTLLMNIFNNEIFVYLTIAFSLFIIFVYYLKNQPNHRFMLTDGGKPQFLRLKRKPLLMRHELERAFPDEETRRKSRKWPYKKLLKKVKKTF